MTDDNTKTVDQSDGSSGKDKVEDLPQQKVSERDAEVVRGGTAGVKKTMQTQV